jgi:hypothetical protein
MGGQGTEYQKGCTQINFLLLIVVITGSPRHQQGGGVRYDRWFPFTAGHEFAATKHVAKFGVLAMARCWLLARGTGLRRVAMQAMGPAVETGRWIGRDRQSVRRYRDFSWTASGRGSVVVTISGRSREKFTFLVGVRKVGFESL